MNSKLFVGADSSLGGNLFISKTAVIAGDTTMNSRLFVGSDTSLGGNLFISKTAVIAGDMSMNSKLFVGADSSLGGSLFVLGNSTMNKDVYMNARLFVGGDSSLNQNLYVGQTIGVGRVAQTGYALDVSGVINCTGINIGVLGETDTSGLTVGAILNANGGIYVPSNAATTFNSTNTFSGSTTMNGSTTINGIINLTNGLTVSKDASFNNRLFVTGDVSFGTNTNINNLVVNGTSRFPVSSIDASSINNTYNSTPNNYFVDTFSTQTIAGDKSFSGNLYFFNDPPFNTNVINGNVFTGTNMVATTSYVGQAISYLVGSAPAILSTLGQIAETLSGDVMDLMTAINQKVSLAGGDMSGNLSVGNVLPINRGKYVFDVSGTAHISNRLTVDADSTFGGNINAANGFINQFIN